MAASSITQFTKLLKELYQGQKATIAWYKEHPFLGLVPKNRNFKGKSKLFPVVHSHGAGRSANFDVALDQARDGSATASVAFDVTRKKDYAIAHIDNETMMASRGDIGAFIEAGVLEVDAKMNSIKGSLAQALYGDGSGAIGQVGAYVANATSFTLLKLGDAVNFFVGQRLVFDADKTSLSDTDIVYVRSVDRSAGIITCEDSAGSDVDLDTLITGFAVNHYIFNEGDFGAKISGLEAWIPSSTSGLGTAFYSVTRSVDPDRLAGMRYNGAGMPAHEALLRACAQVRVNGGKPDTILMNPINYTDLEISLGSKVIYDVAKSKDALVGFDAIVISTGNGKVKVVSDPDCPQDVAWVLQMDTWELATLGDAPQVLEFDDGSMVRVTDKDEAEVRIGYYGNLGCYHPGANCRVALA